MDKPRSWSNGAGDKMSAGVRKKTDEGTGDFWLFESGGGVEMKWSAV